MSIKNWTIQDSDELYNVSRWGQGYFRIGPTGTIQVTPKGTQDAGVIDLHALIEDLRSRGISLPVLLRFSDILGKRISEINQAFGDSIKEYNYRGNYRVVVPIKVNQQKHVVEELISAGRQYHIGLEAGSKPELLAAIAMVSDPESTIICNGYKDFEYLETALLSCKLGLRTIIICDRFQEIEALVELKKRRNLVGPIGVRAKLNSKGAGRWAESGGESSKFGLTASELVRATELLTENGMMEQLVCLHFHIGSQITAIRAVTSAIKEASRIFVDLCKLGANLKFLDVGGGLAVDYDGSATNFSSSMNYTLKEYAADIVSEVRDACDAAKIEHPTILSESGRAMVAHHSVLAFDVLGVNEVIGQNGHAPDVGEGDHDLVRELRRILDGVTVKNFQEALNDANDLREQLNSLFVLGYIQLKQRAKADELFWAIARKVDGLTKNLSYIPDELERLQKMMYDTYYCNFSVFQSVPDHWAVGALFPISPLQQLNVEPTRRAILADLTCDSDGKISKFVDLHDIKTTLPLHRFDGSNPYYIGVFMVGAYQETLGDLHNLFGDTNVVHISLDGNGGYRIHTHIIGDTVSDVLGYMEYDPKDLIRRVRMATEQSLKEGKMSFEEVRLLMKRYETGLTGYTYLEGEDQMM